MTLLDTVNVGGSDYGYLAVTVLGSCATPAGTEIKQTSFSDNFQLRAGVSIAVQFTYANTYGDGSATYPKLRVNGTDYPIKFSNGDYAGDGAWDNGQIVAFMFDGTNLIAGAGSGGGSSGGVPLGTVIAVHSNTVPNGYLPCNGVQFDTTQFPALYGLLGDDHTPDLRECAITGIGKNTTDIFDSTETDPNTGLAGTQTHDVFTLGEFKDDQLQNHAHYIDYSLSGSPDNGFLLGTKTGQTSTDAILPITARTGAVTRGKRKGLNLCIKALSGLDPSQQDTVLAALSPVDVVEEDNMHAVTSNAVAKATAVSGLVELVSDSDLDIYCRKCGRLVIFCIRTKTTGVHSFTLPTGYKCVTMAEGLKTALCWNGNHIGEAYVLQDGTGIVANAVASADSSGELITFLAEE